MEIINWWRSDSEGATAERSIVASRKRLNKSQSPFDLASGSFTYLVSIIVNLIRFACS